jgi:hypothetical protein
MQNLMRRLGAFGVIVLIAASPILMSARTSEEVSVLRNPAPVVVINPATEESGIKAEALSLYEEMDLESLGLSSIAFEYAWKGYNHLLDKKKIRKKDVLTICDFSQSSRNKRMYIIDVEDRRVLFNTYVAHGRASGGEYATSFSNKPESHKSSLGFYITQQTYFGSHGLSLKINGVEKGINDKANYRNIVIHGSNYIGDKFIENNPFNGRSFGCPAIPADETEDVIQTIKNGSCLFIYHPSSVYRQKSSII